MTARHKSFHAQYKADFTEITYVYDYDGFVDEMRGSSYDLLFLDHDLSVGTINMNPDDYDERSGTDVAEWLVENLMFLPKEDKPGIVVHSMNPVGRIRMVDILSNAGFDAVECPFTRLINTKVTFSYAPA